MTVGARQDQNAWNCLGCSWSPEMCFQKKTGGKPYLQWKYCKWNANKNSQLNKVLTVNFSMFYFYCCDLLQMSFVLFRKLMKSFLFQRPLGTCGPLASEMNPAAFNDVPESLGMIWLSRRRSGSWLRRSALSWGETLGPAPFAELQPWGPLLGQQQALHVLLCSPAN